MLGTEAPARAREPATSPAVADDGEVYAVAGMTIPGPAGDIPVRVYRPTPADGLPVLVYLHAGGWVLGGLELSDATCRRLAQCAGCVVVSVDYRIAPQHGFPAPVEDAYAVTRWVTEHAARVYADRARVAVGGAGAGAGLAAATCLLARDLGEPAIVCQLLVSPAVCCPAEPIEDHAAAFDAAAEFESVDWCWDHYLHSRDARENPYASPIFGDLAGLPPALVVTGEHDPLRDDAEAYAARLSAAGVRTRMLRYADAGSSMLGLVPEVATAPQAVRDSAKLLACWLSLPPVDPAPMPLARS